MLTETTRRKTLGWLTRTLGVALGVMYAVPAAVYLRGRRVLRKRDQALDIGAFDDFVDGVPRRVALPLNDLDAWSEGAGTRASVFAVRSGARMIVLDSACPHTGCAVEWMTEQKQFRCPCHRSAFAETGDRLSGPAPRGLDQQNVELKNGRVLVQYTHYRSGSTDRVRS